jgi:putative radical SAM enzyme (TIGR03279 family)
MMVRIESVDKNSRAYTAGILAGDVLISINGREICDVLDYRFFLAERSILLKLSRDGAEYETVIKKQQYDDIGLDFETPLMDKKHSCENKCVFCFIDQLPKGMRKTLYFKDDDSRLSFLHGNYITLTNLHDKDIDRIIEMHISPVNVSVHATNPELRVKMMKNKRAGDVLRYLRRLADAGIKLRGQIVLCRGINDGEELTRSMTDLSAYAPALDSVSVVPAGLTAHREGLYPLEPFTPDECAAVIDQIEAFNASLPERLFFASDEFYLKCGRPLPEDEYYGEYCQIENGVGMLTSFGVEFSSIFKTLDDDEKRVKREISVATGEAAYDFIRNLTEKLTAECPDLTVHVYPVKNNFFGGQVTVTGLLTGQDLLEQLSGRNLGETLYLSRTTLRAEGDLFLCGMSPEELSEKLGVNIEFIENDGSEFCLKLLGLE